MEIPPQLLIDFRPFVGAITPFVTGKGPPRYILFFRIRGVSIYTWDISMHILGVYEYAISISVPARDLGLTILITGL